MAFGQLRWEKRQAAFHPAIGDTNLVARFAFANGTDRVVRILKIDSSCGCTTATVERPLVKAGEKGEVAATFTFGDRLGPQNKTLMVSTDDPSESTVILKLLVDIPAPWKMEPGGLFWKLGERASAKTVKITVLQKQAMSIAAAAQPPGWSTQLKAIKAGRVYELVVTPGDTRAPVGAALVLEGSSSGLPVRSMHVPVCVGKMVPPTVPASVSDSTDPQGVFP